MNTATQTLTLGRPKSRARRAPLDWLFALLILGGAGYAFNRYGASMDYYE
jgi:hypothetical protein